MSSIRIITSEPIMIAKMFEIKVPIGNQDFWLKFVYNKYLNKLPIGPKIKAKSKD
jgi:hypothetical protein